MKKTLSLLLSMVTLVLLVNTTFANNVQDGTKPHIQFEKTTHDYGTIYKGADGNVTFSFVNTGQEPLIIQNVKTSCGCTVASKPSAPILPGESSEISVKYDTKRIGSFHKNITVTSNGDNPSVILNIKGKIIQQPAEEVPQKEVKEGFTPVSTPKN